MDEGGRARKARRNLANTWPQDETTSFSTYWSGDEGLPVNEAKQEDCARSRTSSGKLALRRRRNAALYTA